MKERGVKFKIGLICILSIILISGCSSENKETKKVQTEDHPIDINNEEESNDDNEASLDDLETINDNPVGKYKAQGVTNFVVIKEYQPGKTMPDIYLEKDHPYIVDIESTLEKFFTALYEIDYKTITADRHKPFFEGELEPDSSFTDISLEQEYEVITAVKDIELRSINFEPGMQKARIGSSVTYFVKQSSETQHPYANKYLEGNNMIVDVTSDVENIDGTWKVTHAIELVPEILED